MRRRGRRRDESGWNNAPGEDRERAPRVAVEMRSVYLLLGSIIGVSVALSLIFKDVPDVERFAPGVATDSFGILLTLVFVHRFLERQERSSRLRGSIGALRRGSRALLQMVEAWTDLIKGTLPRVPGDPIHNYLDLFAPHFVENITYVDAHRMKMREGEDPEAWVVDVSRRVEAAREALNQTIVAYSASLDPAYVEAIDEVVDDGFLRMFHQMVENGIDARAWRVRMNASRATRETFFARLAAAIRLHNQLAKEASTVRSRRIAPRTGSVGMELPLDHDLRVDLELPRRWWALEPLPGAVRSDTERTG
jgi:hypothetical protein